MKKNKNTARLVVLFVVLSIITQLNAQEPTDKVWNVYVSTLQQALKPGLDPCLYVYTVTTSENLRVQRNIELGLMAELHSNLTYYAATAYTRTYGIYFDDEPDGKYKLGSCRESDVVMPDLSCTWSSKFGDINWLAGWYSSTSKSISGKLTLENGKWIYVGTWKWLTNNVDYGKVRFEFDETGTKFSGYYTRKTGTSQYKWHGSGNCN
ncbi:hypothetical protein RM697_03845 [Ichthyenterobacterium sp. W332]|uniref:Uncharacterized protein n=1 Tax=Microcosmobacter mediterraneus TaxID=3075607 RepID=A0ABU2YHY1_9FLAO|nr:hypothetical protein [Ichthyenterobacterium sp. W332]MDT0557763.1 hypothetical protein [Ichthyenterobacterium sp. W332]